MSKVHLCCGPVLHLPGWINVDAVNFGQEVVADLNKPWDFVPEGSVSEIRCDDGFEHVLDGNHFLKEAARILKPGGTLQIWVPHYKNPSAYRVTHLRICSWSMFNAYPEPHDVTQALRIKSNRLYIGWKASRLWAPIHALINLFPKWWERFFYASNIEVVFERISH